MIQFVEFGDASLRRVDFLYRWMLAMDAIKKVGFVGLGMMGAPMARRLAKAGHELYLRDASPQRQTQLQAELDANALNDEAISAIDVLVTMLPNSDIVEAVLLGGESGAGVAGGLHRGSTVIDMSSSEPARSRALAKTLAELGLDYLDAPVSGGVKRAESGELAILVGGKAEVLATCYPLLEQMGSKILHIGAAGAGHAAKALNNYVSAAGLVATVEALRVAERFGIEPAVMTDVLNASTGRSNTSENKVANFMLNGNYNSGFALQLMVKDLKIARTLAGTVGYPMALGQACVSIWEEAERHSTPATDHTEMYRLLAANDANGGPHSGEER